MDLTYEKGNSLPQEICTSLDLLALIDITEEMKTDNFTLDSGLC